MSKILFPYRIRVTAPDGTSRVYNVHAYSTKEAKTKAALQASLERLPAFDCKIEIIN